jgi:membrane fusion protein (multidrug efflux system)
MFKKLSLTGLLLFLLVAPIVAIKALQISALMAMGKTMVPTPEAVTTAEVHEETWRPSLNAVGSFAAVQGITLGSEASGTVSRINFESGAEVAAGTVLVELDTSVEQAQLASAQANAELARLNGVRANSLRQQNTNSQAELDAVVAQGKQAEAEVNNLQAVIAKRRVTAPFAGRVGIRQVNLGQFLAVGTPIVSLQSLDPIYVNFSLPQQNLSQLSEGLGARVTTDVYPGREFNGQVTAINPDLDATTRSVKLQLTLANPSGLLRPGMFGSVSVDLPVTDKVLTIPATSVLYAPYGDTVFVVEDGKDAAGVPQKTVRQQFVRLGVTRGDFVAVISGLKLGDSIVSAGVFKLRNGVAISVDNSLAPDARLAPTPTDS